MLIEVYVRGRLNHIYTFKYSIYREYKDIYKIYIYIWYKEFENM